MSACPAWCQLPAGHRFADGAVVHVRMAERMERAGEPLWFVIEAGDGDAVLASVFGETENLTLAELDGLMGMLQRGRAALAEILA